MGKRLLTPTEVDLLRHLDQRAALVSRHELRDWLGLSAFSLARTIARVRRKIAGRGVWLLSSGRGWDEGFTLQMTGREAFDAVIGWQPAPILMPVPMPGRARVSLPRVGGVAYAYCGGRLTGEAA